MLDDPVFVFHFPLFTDLFIEGFLFFWAHYQIIYFLQYNLEFWINQMIIELSSSHLRIKSFCHSCRRQMTVKTMPSLVPINLGIGYRPTLSHYMHKMAAPRFQSTISRLIGQVSNSEPVAPCWRPTFVSNDYILFASFRLIFYS